MVSVTDRLKAAARRAAQTAKRVATRATRGPITSATTTPVSQVTQRTVTPTARGLKVTDFPGGESVVTETKAGRVVRRTVSRGGGGGSSTVTGATIQSGPSDAELLAAVQAQERRNMAQMKKEDEARQRRESAEQKARSQTITGQVQAGGITGSAVGIPTPSRVAKAFSDPERVKRGAKAAGSQLLEGQRQVFGTVGGVTSDVLSAAFLRPAALAPTKETAVSGEELERRSQRARRSLSPQVSDFIPSLGAVGNLIVGRRQPQSGLEGTGAVGALGRGQIESFRQLRQFRRESKEAQDIKKQAQEQSRFLESRAPVLEEIARREVELSSGIEASNVAGGFTEDQVTRVEREQKRLQRSREKVLKEITSKGITPTVEGDKITFKSSAIEADIGLASIKQLKAIPTKKGRAVAVGGAIASEAAKFAATGAGLRAVGVTAAVGRGLAALPKAAQVGGGIILSGGIAVSTGLTGVKARQEAKRIGAPVGASTVLGFGEPIAQVAGLIIGADPSKSPIQVKTIRTPDGQLALRSLVVKTPFAGAKGVVPVATKAQVGSTVTASGTKPIFKTSFGIPKGGFISPTGEFTPSGAIETKLFLKTLKNVPVVQQKLIKSSFDLTRITKGVKVGAPTDSNVFLKSEGFGKLSPAQQKIAGQFLSKATGGKIIVKGRVFGSAASDVQLQKGLARPIKDVDVQFGFKSADKTAKTLVGILNKAAGAKVSTVPGKTGQIVIGQGKSAVKVFDLHGVDATNDLTQAVKKPFGLGDRGTIRVGNTNVNKLTQEGINKLASVSSLDAQGGVPGTTKNRIKDVGDFFRIQQALANQLEGAKATKALKLLATAKSAALTKFGPKAFAPGQKEILGISQALPSTSPGAAASTFSVSAGLTLPKTTVKGVSPSIPTSPSISPSPIVGSISPSASPSVSFSVSPPSSPSLPSSASPSISPSASPSISLSVSPSPSPSISASPSLSPSVSPSPSPSVSTVADVQPIPPPPGGFPLPLIPISFKRGTPGKRQKRSPKIKFVPSITGTILNIRVGATPKQLSVGGFSPFKIRGVPTPSLASLTPKKKKKKKKKVRKKKK